MEYWQLAQRQNLPLEAKILHTKKVIKEWYEHWEGNVFVSFSGGKDSTVLLDIVRSMYPDVPAVFANTGLEYPEIVEFVKTIDNVIWTKPKKSFRKVLEEHGYPVISKRIAEFIEVLRRNPNSKKRKEFEKKKKWQFLMDAPFKISSKCCNEIKIKPIKLAIKKLKAKPMIGVLAEESQQRTRNYIKNGGCTVYTKYNEKCTPLAIWKEEDIWNYIRTYNIPYSKIYDMGYGRTGCMFCMFGVHMDEPLNRFQMMAKTHPQLYNYCIHKLELNKVLDFLKIEYKLINKYKLKIDWTQPQTKKYQEKYKKNNHQYYLNKIKKGYLKRERTYKSKLNPEGKNLLNNMNTDN